MVVVKFLPSCVALLMAACTGAGGGTADPSPSGATASIEPHAANAAALAEQLPRYHWRLRDATTPDGRRIDALFVRADKPVTVDFADGRMSVGNACNRMGGTYVLAGQTLTAGQFVSTRMACADPGLMALDQEIGNRLEGALTASVTTGDAPILTLVSASGDTLALAGEPTAQTRFGGPGERIFLEVAAQTRPCSHPLIPDMQCLQVRERRYDDKGLQVGTPGEFGNFYEPIEGYTHQPGMSNVLRVQRYTRKDVPADASRYAYVLDRVVESAREDR